VDAVAATAAPIAQTVEAAFAEIERIAFLMGRESPSGDVARLNRTRPGSAVTIDVRTRYVLARATSFWRASRGRFDIAVLGARPRRSRSRPRQPGWRLAGDRFAIRRGPSTIDLDGIAKGYAVDRAVCVLRRHGVLAGAVSAGGDLRVF